MSQPTANSDPPQHRHLPLVKVVFAWAFYALLLGVSLWNGRTPVFLAFLPFLFFADRLVARFLNIRPDLMKLRPLEAGDVPPSARQYFEEHTWEFEQSGFLALGDFSLKQRSSHISRFFINHDGTLFGELTCVRALASTTQACSVFSVTPDLTYVETGNLKVPNDKPFPRFVLRGVPGASVHETVAAHQEHLAEALDANESPLGFDSDDLELICLYGQKMLYDALVAQNVATENPYRELSLSEHFNNRDSAATLAKEELVTS